MTLASEGGICAATRVELPAPNVAKVTDAHALDDGAALLATGDGALVLWDVAAAREARRWRFKRPVIALASTRDGRTMAAVTDDALWVAGPVGADRRAGQAALQGKSRFSGTLVMLRELDRFDELYQSLRAAGRKDPYDVLLISADGQSRVFAAYPK